MIIIADPPGSGKSSLYPVSAFGVAYFIGQKSPDTSAIPLCAKHHRTGKDSYHRLGPRKFSKTHNLDIPAIVCRLNLKPFIRVEGGFFVTYLADQKYVLGKTEAGIRPAVREALHLSRENRLAQEIAS
jgi:hypothetical protein